MSVNKETFEQRRDFNEDLQASGAPLANWRQADRLPDHLVPTHCCFYGVQCGMYLKVAGGEVIGVEPRVFPHNRGALCPKGVVAYQQVHHPERLNLSDAAPQWQGGHPGPPSRESVERLYGHLPPEAEQHESRQSTLVQPRGRRHDNVPSHGGERGLASLMGSR